VCASSIANSRRAKNCQERRRKKQWRRRLANDGVRALGSTCTVDVIAHRVRADDEEPDLSVDERSQQIEVIPIQPSVHRCRL
jgi:hypothetical protein